MKQMNNFIIECMPRVASKTTSIVSKPAVNNAAESAICAQRAETTAAAAMLDCERRISRDYCISESEHSSIIPEEDSLLIKKFKLLRCTDKAFLDNAKDWNCIGRSDFYSLVFVNFWTWLLYPQCITYWWTIAKQEQNADEVSNFKMHRKRKRNDWVGEDDPTMNSLFCDETITDSAILWLGIAQSFDWGTVARSTSSIFARNLSHKFV